MIFGDPQIGRLIANIFDISLSFKPFPYKKVDYATCIVPVLKFDKF